MKIGFGTAILLMFCKIGFNQAGITGIDAALNYNKLLVDKSSSGDFIRVGLFRVVGTPYLFGHNQKGTVYSKKEMFKGILFSYNVYLKRIELTIQGSSQFIIIENALVDSFIFYASSSQGKYEADMHFTNPGNINPKEKDYLQVLFTGNNFSLYKKYRCDLGNVPTNYIEADLRQFDWSIDYYIQKAGDSKLLKIKPNKFTLEKLFASKKACFPEISEDQLMTDTENYLVFLFSKADACK